MIFGFGVLTFWRFGVLVAIIATLKRYLLAILRQAVRYLDTVVNSNSLMSSNGCQSL